MDYFNGSSIFGLLINIMIFYNLLTICPLINYYGRMQLLQFHYDNRTIPNTPKRIFNLLYLSSCLICGILNVSPINVLAFLGSFCGFYIIYFLPIVVHLNCLYRSRCINNIESIDIKCMNNIVKSNQVSKEYHQLDQLMLK